MRARSNIARSARGALCPDSSGHRWRSSGQGSGRKTPTIVAGFAPTPASRGSVLLVVMITLVFASFALVVFMDKASNDLLVEQRDAETRRLRQEAYSALEVTLCVLEEFRQANNGLRSPAEGWNDPLAFAEYEPSDGRKVTIAFEDESGKISLPRITQPVLEALFKNWDLPENEAESLADAMMGWMKKEHVYSTGLFPTYEQSTIPFEEPRRSLRSYQELAAIDKVRETFFTEDGQPNELWQRFIDSVSLLDFPTPNINGAKPGALAALGQFDETQQQGVADYLQGKGAYEGQGARYFREPSEVQQIAGGLGNAGAFTSNISALRIFVTVQDGRSEFRLAAVITPPNGAKTVQTTATEQKTTAAPTSGADPAAKQDAAESARAANPANSRAGQPGAGGAGAATDRNLRYPFTLLEIRENDEIPSAPVVESSE